MRARFDEALITLSLPTAYAVVDVGRLSKRDVRVGYGTPTILLTQVGEASERALALEEGADDYLNKPFDPHELLARVRAVLRRARPGEKSLSTAWLLTADNLVLDRRARRATLAGKTLDLTPKALAVLEHLMTHPNEAVTRERLLEVVWGWEYPAGTRTVDSHVKALRRKLGPGLIRTVHGVGYSAEPEGDDTDEGEEPEALTSPDDGHQGRACPVAPAAPARAGRTVDHLGCATCARSTRCGPSRSSSGSSSAPPVRSAR